MKIMMSDYDDRVSVDEMVKQFDADDDEKLSKLAIQKSYSKEEFIELISKMVHNHCDISLND